MYIDDVICVFIVNFSGYDACHTVTHRIEPEWYCPILPMVLVNGCDGIGTGYSTSVPNFNPREIVDNLRRLMNGLEPMEMV